MVMWQEMSISLTKCNFTPFYPIEVKFSPEITEFYAENYYYIFTIVSPNFLFNAKFGHHIYYSTIAVTGKNTNK